MHWSGEGLRQYEESVATPPKDQVDSSTPTYSRSTMNNFGTDPHKLYRKDSPATSVEAAYSVDTTALEQMVYEAIRRRPDGCIADELDRKSTRLNSSHVKRSRMPSSA